MEPITDSGGRLFVFGVGRGDGGRWLHGDFGLAGFFWRGDRRWVFLRRK